MKNRSKIIFLVTCFVQFALDLGAQSVNEKIDAIMQKYVELDQFSGTVLLAKEGEVLYAKAFGESNKSYHIKHNLDTKFNIASMGKMFTGVSIMQLEEREKLKVSDPVIKYLKNFPLGDKITIHHLLSHTSGIGSYMRHPDYRANRSAFKKTSDLLPIIYEQKLRFETPGERFSYSNSGMIILGAVIEEISGKSYSDYITENIFTPLNMNDTHMKINDETVENRATGYIKSVSSKFKSNIYSSSPPHADGGILSTVGDLLKFDQALYSTILINEGSKKKLFTALKVDYGYAFGVLEKHDNKVVGHGGGAPGISTEFWRYLKDKYAIIVLSNYDMISRNVVYYIDSILYGKSYELPRQRLRHFIYENMDKIDALGSLEAIKNIIKENDYSLRSPQRLNMIAYEFLHEEKSAIAIKLFKLNVHLFPEEANVYDSLGEAYEDLKQYDLALKNYKKAVEVATKNADLSLNSFTATLERFQKEYHK